MSSHPFDLSGKVALVTGGSGGIGGAISRALALAGAAVGVMYLDNPEEAEALVTELKSEGGQAAALQFDVGQVTEAGQLVEQAVELFGQVDILVNNAGIADLAPYDKVTETMMERTHRVNVMGPFFLAQQVANHLRSRQAPGRIINITSTNGFVAEALLAPYNASKGAMEMMTKSLAIELGPYGITVNSVAPGLIGTEIGDDFPLDPEFWEYAREHVPLGRIAESEEVSGAVVYLASKAAGYVTGQHIIVDGGLTADQFPRLQFYRG